MDEKIYDFDNIEDIYPLSDIQAGMLYESLIPGTASAYYSQTQEVLIRDKNFNFDLFKRALSLLVDKHPMLRTGFDIGNPEKPVQVVYKKIPLEIGYHDVSRTGPAAREAYIKSCLQREREKCFNLSGAEPLWRSIIFKTGEEEYYFTHINHHAIHDGWSLASFLTELNNTYLRLQVEPHFVPAKLKSTYKNFIIEQVIEKKNVKTIEFWKNELSDYQRCEIPGGGSKNIGKTNKISTRRDIGIQTLEKLASMAKKYGISLRNIFFAAYVYTLYMVSYENDFVVGMVTHIRPECEDSDKIIGCFLNEVPVRVSIPARLKWIDFIRLIDRKVIRLTDYNKLSLLEVARIIGEITPGKNPIIDTIFNFNDFHVYNRMDRSIVGEMEPNTDNTDDNTPLFERIQGETNTFLEFDVDISVLPELTVSFSGSVLTNEMVERLCRYFMEIIRRFSDETESAVQKEAIMTGEERQKIVYEFNKTAADFPREKTIPQLFEEQVERTPGYVALVGPAGEAKKRRSEEEKKEEVPPGEITNYKLQITNKEVPSGQVLDAFGEMPVFGDDAALDVGPVRTVRPVQPVRPVQLTYRELNEQSGRLAHLLIEKGVGPDTIVGIMMERSLEMIIGLMAILKSGGAYLPIDRDYPKERIDYMLKDSGAVLVLTAHPLEEALNGSYKSHMSYTSPGNPPNFLTSQLPNFPLLAYVIYTSGTTGGPKGVMVEHRGVVRLVKNAGYIHYSMRERLLPTGSAAFDISTFETWGPLLNSAAIVLESKEVILNVKMLGNVLVKYDISIMHLIPPLFNPMIEQDVGLFAGLRYFLIGGDLVKPETINRLRHTYPELKIIHCYGPTENTTFSTTFRVEKDYEVRIPIGKPIGNTSVYIVDKYGHLQPVGVPGELLVGGDGIARGYLNNPELSAEKFVISRLAPHRSHHSPLTTHHSPIYRTGDLARWLDDGNIEFLGRIDNQVKIRGFRIELGEIERRLENYPGITGEVVVEKNINQEKYLCAYIVADKIEISALRKHLSMALPDYMVPTYFTFIDKIPLTPTGKIDRKALPGPVINVKEEYKAPQNETEEKLTGIWSNLLKIEKNQISIDADFFRIGGHSIKTAIMVTQIQKEFNLILPLVEVFKNPTIESLSGYIKQAAPGIITIKDDRLTLLKPGVNSDKHLFFIHDGTGDVEGYVELCKGLNIGAHCWGIRANRLENYTPVNLSLQNIAASYIITLRQVQAHGPYCIAGWSLGGVIAFEIAAQLEAAGETAAFLGLIDAPNPQADQREPIPPFSVETEVNLLMDYWPDDQIKEKVKHLSHIDKIWPMVVNHLEENNFSIDTIKSLIPDNLARAIPNYKQAGTRELIYYLNVNRTLNDALFRYRPHNKINAVVHYFKASQSPGVIKKGWQDYSNKSIEVYEIEGDHFSILKKPMTAHLGRILEAKLMGNSGYRKNI